MKTKSLLACFTILSAMAMFTSCKKESGSEPVILTPAPVLSSKDPQAVSAAVKVWHGERMQGNAPSPKGAGLELDAPSSAPVTQAFNGRFAIINPQISTGDVAGYYLKINGSKEYFKIDYSKPRGARLAKTPKKQAGFNLSARFTSAQDNADSAIVIALPATLKVPDTICVSYCAYDVQGNVSNVVSTCIIINSLGTDAANSWINGVWKITAQWDTSLSQAHDTIIFNRWYPTNKYYCQVDPATGESYLTYYSNGSPVAAADSAFHLKNNLSFSANGGLSYEFDESNKDVNLSTSNCTQIFYNPLYTNNDKYTGAWNYNPATGKMVLVFEFSDNGTPGMEAFEYSVTKISSTNMVLADYSYNDPSYIRFEK